MRDLNSRNIDRWRVRNREVLAAHGSYGDAGNGMFAVPSPIDGGELKVIASNGGGWEHVSVSRKNRCPKWQEMAFIKDRFFKDDELVMQLHVPKSEHINFHRNCLHLWRPLTEVIPLPPAWMVGPSG